MEMEWKTLNNIGSYVKLCGWYVFFHGIDVKKVQIIMTLRGYTLDWFMKFCAAPAGAPQKNLDEIRAAMISEFRKPKLDSQCITEIKEIK